MAKKRAYNIIFCDDHISGGWWAENDDCKLDGIRQRLAYISRHGSLTWKVKDANALPGDVLARVEHFAAGVAYAESMAAYEMEVESNG